MGDKPELLQKLERAVDGRDVDAVRGLLHGLRDLFGCRVPEPHDGFQDELALRCQPVPLRAQFFAQVRAR